MEVYHILGVRIEAFQVEKGNMLHQVSLTNLVYDTLVFLSVC